MNERIKELAEQAGPLQDVLSEIHGGTPGRYVKNKALLDFQLEKFAELIVGECITSIANDTANYQEEGMMAYYQGVQDAVKSIKQHFGVKE